MVLRKCFQHEGMTVWHNPGFLDVYSIVGVVIAMCLMLCGRVSVTGSASSFRFLANQSALLKCLILSKSVLSDLKLQ